MASLLKLDLQPAEMLGMLELLGDGQTIQHVSFTGRSMLPLLRQGKDSVELTKAPAQLQKYDLPMYVGQRGKYVMHRIVAVKDDHYICLGDNTYRHEIVRREQIVALVCAVHRGEKRIPVDAKAYRVYCRLWCALFPVRKFAVRVKGWLRRRLR